MVSLLKNVSLIFLSFLLSCQIQPPPFTFTQTQTAAERQMIGEDRNLEPNGWLISSIKTSSSGSESWKMESPEELGDNEEERKEYYIILQTLAYLVLDIKQLKKTGVIGENLEGKLAYNPTFNWKIFKTKLEEREYRNKVENIINTVNTNRETLYKKRIQIEIQKMTGKPEIIKTKEREEFQQKLKMVYYNAVEIGEFYEVSRNEWVRK
jgi:hypothetical protein